MNGTIGLAEFSISQLRNPATHRLYETTDDISISSIHIHKFVEHCTQSIFQLPDHSLHLRDRTATVALARQTAMYLLHTSFGLSLTAIGAYFSRSRKTVAHACAAIENRRDDPAMDRVLSTLERALLPLRDGLR